MSITKEQKMTPNPLHPAAPVASLGNLRYALLASSGSSGVGSGSLNASNLPFFTGSWLRTEVINVAPWDTAAVEIFYNADVSSSIGYPLIVPFGSNQAQVPDFLASGASSIPKLSDDVWFMLPTTDGSITAAALSGTLGVGSGSSLTTVGYQKLYGLTIQGEAVAASGAMNRQMVSLKVRPMRYLTFAVCERGDVAHPGKLQLFVNGVI